MQLLIIHIKLNFEEENGLGEIIKKFGNLRTRQNGLLS